MDRDPQSHHHGLRDRLIAITVSAAAVLLAGCGTEPGDGTSQREGVPSWISVVGGEAEPIVETPSVTLVTGDGETDTTDSAAPDTTPTTAPPSSASPETTAAPAPVPAETAPTAPAVPLEVTLANRGVFLEGDSLTEMMKLHIVPYAQEKGWDLMIDSKGGRPLYWPECNTPDGWAPLHDICAKFGEGMQAIKDHADFIRDRCVFINALGVNPQEKTPEAFVQKSVEAYQLVESIWDSGTTCTDGHRQYIALTVATRPDIDNYIQMERNPALIEGMQMLDVKILRWDLYALKCGCYDGGGANYDGLHPTDPDPEAEFIIDNIESPEGEFVINNTSNNI